MRRLPQFLMLAALFVFAACSENPVAVEEEHADGEEALTVTLMLSDDHVHTLSDVTFTVTLRDHHGAVMMAFEALQVEQRLVGAEEWDAVEMHAEGNAFHGTNMFVTSGEYELRVSGMQHGHNDMEVLHEEHDPLHVGRAHAEIGDYRIEFESFPGHAHEGEATTVKFWVTKADQSVGGLTAEIHCEDPDGAEEEHEAHEDEAGVYHAEHTFGEAGEAHMAIHFAGADGAEVEADFHMPVDHGHGHGHDGN